MVKPSAYSTFISGGIIAYPTEAVFGLGCDPDNEKALIKLLSIKSRSASKGLILLSANYQQLLPYIDDGLIPAEKKATMLTSWPNGVTYVVPANKNISKYLTGKFSTIAVRITSQPDVVALCQLTNKPIVSTSANISGDISASSWQTIDPTLADKVDYLIKGQTLGLTKASKIIDIMSGTIFRS